MPELALEIATALLLLPVVACGGSSAKVTADAAPDSPAVTDAGAGGDVALPPPSLDCRFIDDQGATCDTTYYLPNAELYVCGSLTTTDVYDAGIMRPFPPPLPRTYDCRNVAPPVLDAGLGQQVGALWCCMGAPADCVRAIALDPKCTGGMVALSCPSSSPIFPEGTTESACLPFGGPLVDGSAPDTGVTLTPAQPAGEAIWCCPP